MCIALRKVTLPGQTEALGHVARVQRPLDAERRLHAPVDAKVVHVPRLRDPVRLNTRKQRVADRVLEVCAREILSLQVHGLHVLQLGQLLVRERGGEEVPILPSLEPVVLQRGERGKPRDRVFERCCRLDSPGLDLVTCVMLQHLKPTEQVRYTHLRHQTGGASI